MSTYSTALARLVRDAKHTGSELRHKEGRSKIAKKVGEVVGNSKAAQREGVALGTHLGVALLDNHVGEVPIPFIGKIKPSTIAGILSIAGIVFTKGGKRGVARSMFAGVLHRKVSTMTDDNKGKIAGVISGVGAVVGMNGGGDEAAAADDLDDKDV